MKIDKYEFPDDLLYDKEHNWARVEGNTVTQGLTDFGQDLAGEIVFVEIPRAGREVTQGEPFMSMESGKWVGRVKAVVSGKIAAANGELEWESATVNHSPYADGWLAKIEISDTAQLSKLLSPSDTAYQEFIAAERAKYGK
jgi:glycine cleavage system H protein